MKISMKVDYGVRAILYMANYYGSGPIPSGEIALRQDIPEPYLDQLLNTLRKAGLIRSLRGPRGGHFLARSPEELKLGEVIGALEGPMGAVDCGEEDSGCGRPVNCALRDVWQDIGQKAQLILDSTTIADLARRQSQQEERVVYHI